MDNENAKDNTINYYNNNAQAFIEQTFSLEMKTLYEPFIASLPTRAQSQQRILDVGCRSGRDSLYFAKLGLEVTAIDGSAAFINIAKHPENQYHAYQANINWQHCTFEEIRQKNWQKKFTGIWACTSLFHVSYEELPVLIDTLVDMLADDGIFYISFKYGDTERLNDNRFFCAMNEERWQTITQKVSHKFKVKTWLTRDQRADRSEKWFNIMIK